MTINGIMTRSALTLGPTDCISTCDLDFWTFNPRRAMTIHVQKVKDKSHSIQKLERMEMNGWMDRWTGGGNCITWLTNVVGNNSPRYLLHPTVMFTPTVCYVMLSININKIHAIYWYCPDMTIAWYGDGKTDFTESLPYTLTQTYTQAYLHTST